GAPPWSPRTRSAAAAAGTPPAAARSARPTPATRPSQRPPRRSAHHRSTGTSPAAQDRPVRSGSDRGPGHARYDRAGHPAHDRPTAVATIRPAPDEPDGRPCVGPSPRSDPRSEEHTSELQSRGHLVCRLLLEKKKS